VLRLPGGRQATLTIGRSRGCDLVLADSTVSRTHAVLRRFGDEWFLEDLGSTNGTRLNGFTIRAATAVRPGDWVGVGRLTFRVARSARP
jgi:pSer/pThr/pTyr-binding forkhead associated (FHA) protein